MEHARHVFRIVLVVAVMLAVVLLARGFLVPKSYGMYGPLPVRQRGRADERPRRRSTPARPPAPSATPTRPPSAPPAPTGT